MGTSFGVLSKIGGAEYTSHNIPNYLMRNILVYRKNLRDSNSRGE